MNQTVINFTANNQRLALSGEPLRLASKTVNFVKAHFELGENWNGFDSVRAVWSTDFNNGVSAVLDSLGDCVVPHEVLARTGIARVNLVGSVSEGDVLTDRLTTCLVSAIEVCCNVPVDGTNSQTVTPSQFEQFVEAVRDDADRAETASTEARESATEASESATSASQSASASAESATASEQAKDLAQSYAQNAQISAQTAENAKDDAESARDEILGMRATATTLTEGSEATASYSNGLLTLGIPRGDTGATGAKGDKGDTGATPNLTIGNVETLEPSESATATITGTAENPVLNLGIPQGDTGEVSLADLSTLLPTDTASGSIASFPDGQSVIPMVSLLADIEPIQDLHGYDKPWSGGAGANKWDEEWEVGALIADGSVDGNLTTRRTTSYISVTPDTNYYVVNALALRGRYAYYDENKALITFDGNGLTNNRITTPNNAHYLRITLQTSYGTVYNHDVAVNYPSTVTTYSPYSNICPISGRTEVVTVVSPTTSASDGQTYTTDLGRTVYGGTLDVVSGVLTVTHGIVDLGTLTWSLYDGVFYANVDGKAYLNTNADMICDSYPIYATNAVNVGDAKTKLSDGEMCGFRRASGQSTASYVYIEDSRYSTATELETALDGAMLCYELATPQTIQLTPQEVYALLGDNNIWADSGSVEVVYKADVTKWVEKKLNS